MVDLDQLRPAARAGALRLARACPMVVFTSGRRDLVEQAHDMAIDVAAEIRLEHNKNWISQTYIPGPVQRALQDAVDQATVPTDYGDLFVEVLQQFSDDDLAKFSAHLGGDAWDVQPVGEPESFAIVGEMDAIVRDHRLAGGSGKVLLREGGLVRWHVQMHPLPTPAPPPNVA